MSTLTPICARFPEDLDIAVRTKAEQEGLTPSEMLRAIVNEWVYKQMPSVDEGYYQARQLAVRIAHEALQRAIDLMPTSYEDAVTYNQK